MSSMILTTEHLTKTYQGQQVVDRLCLSIREHTYVHSDNLRQIVVYPAMLARALINIVENAIQFTKTGGYITIA